MNASRRRDLVAALLCLMFGLAAVLFLIPRGVAVPGSVKVAALSPDFWPRLIAYGAIAASVFLFIETLIVRQAAARPDDAEPDDAEPDDAEEEARYRLAALPATVRVAVLVAALFAFYAGLTALGVVAASILLLFAMMLFFGERDIRLVAGLSVAIPLLLYAFFRYAASVPIPLGIFGS